MIKLQKFSILAAVFLIIVSFQNCAVVSSDSEADQAAIAASADQADLRSKAMNIISNRCASCHNSTNPQGGIDYITDVNLLLYYRLVIPGDPQHSELYTEIQSGRMPIGKPLSQAESKVIFDWIQDGFKGSTPVAQPVAKCMTLGPTFDCIKNTLVANKCLNCHANFNTYAGVKGFVTAGSPAASLFYTSLRTTMPKGNPSSVTVAEQNAVMTWILNGAPNN